MLFFTVGFIIRYMHTIMMYINVSTGIFFQMSEIVGFNLKPDPATPLNKMLEYGLTKYLEK